MQTAFCRHSAFCIRAGRKAGEGMYRVDLGGCVPHVLIYKD